MSDQQKEDQFAIFAEADDQSKPLIMTHLQLPKRVVPLSEFQSFQFATNARAERGLSRVDCFVESGG